VAYGGIRPGTEGASALKQAWDAVFHLKGFEEAAIVNDFDRPQGVDATGSTLNIRILPAVTARTAGDTAQLGVTDLTYETATILNVTDTPTFTYAIVGIPKNLSDRLGGPDTAQLEAGYRKQMLGAIMAAVDADGGSLGSGISTVKGPGNFDKSQILDCQTSLATNSKNHIVVGQTEVHLRYHPSQIKYIGNIAEFANANQRGDAANPNVKGVILKAWGMTFAETGNILFSGGFYWNMMFAKTFAVLAYNQAPQIDGTEEYGFSTLIKGHADYLNVEVFDEDAVTFKSA
jgi:hypothetical protein